jgi:uncharacterized protein YdhG (YjbR/CyaY superfamily)
MNAVTDLIADLPDDERVIAARLRTLILESEPRLQEKLSYGVPYFFHNRRVCFIWPASCIPVGYSPKEPIHTKVTLGLCYGNLLSNDQGLLEKGDRKQVYTLGFTSAAEVNDQVIREIILEAVMVDDQFKKTNKKKS